MHIEVQVALNFVISYLYNKLPRRRVNLFGEELEKALDAKFQGHWYPDKPFKGSAFRCLKTGDPIDAVLDRAARESGVPIQDILENLPAELAVWIDPGEVSYRIGEKGQVKILHSESNDHHEDSSADREVTKTFNPEAQCFRPIDAVITNMTGLSLSPKTSPQDSPPTSAPSPTFKSTMPTSPAPAGAYLPRSQAPLTFTTATFAQTKFGSTKLKTSSKRANRMSPTEFSNYIKQRAMQQQLHHSHGHTNAGGGHLGAIGQSSPSRSLSPNPLAIGLQNDPFFFPNVNMGMYPPFGGPRNIVDPTHYYPDVGNMYNATSPGKYSSYLEPHNTNGNIYNGVMNGLQASAVNGGGGNGGGGGGGVVPNAAPQQNQAASNGGGVNGGGGGGGTNVPTSSVQQTPQTPVSSPGSNGDNTKLLDSLNSFYNNSGPYQHLLVAN